MPSKTKKPCAYPRCPSLTTETYCSNHKIQRQFQNAESNKHYDKHIRDKRSTSFYNSKAWRDLRLVALSKDNFLCRSCLKEKKVVKADVVDHIIPIKKNWSKRLTLSNLQSLCHACHNAKTAKES